MRYLTKILIFVLTLNLNAQDNGYDKKTFGIGISTSTSNGRIPIQTLALTPYVFAKLNRHEVLVGSDIYGISYIGNHYSIYGGQACYKYYLLKSDKHFNVFVDINFQYVQFGQGGGLSVRYNYNIDTWYYNKSFTNTYGIGFLYSFLKNRAAFHFAVDGGYNYFNSIHTSENSESLYIANYPTGNVTKPVLFLKLGLSCKVFRISDSR